LKAEQLSFSCLDIYHLHQKGNISRLLLGCCLSVNEIPPKFGDE